MRRIHPVVIDNDNLLLAPTKGDSAAAKRILPHGALGIVTCRIEDWRM